MNKAPEKELQQQNRNKLREQNGQAPQAQDGETNQIQPNKNHNTSKQTPTLTPWWQSTPNQQPTLLEEAMDGGHKSQGKTNGSHKTSNQSPTQMSQWQTMRTTVPICYQHQTLRTTHQNGNGGCQFPNMNSPRSERTYNSNHKRQVIG